MNVIIYLVVFACAFLGAIFIFVIGENAFKLFINAYNKSHEKRTAKITAKLEESFIFWEKKKMILIMLSPIILAGILLLLLKNPIGIIIGLPIGFAFPNIMVNVARSQRIKKFQGQLVDSLMILSSSLKAGLSFIQAMEVLCEEMPAPASQEFGLILKENKLGISLEDSLKNLRVRVPLEEANLLVTSILIARESGGELPRVLSRLTETIRDNLKLKEKISTLTLQGKLQGYIMMVLPVAFTLFIWKQNPSHFDVMLQTSLGRILIIGAVVAQIVGMVLIKTICTIRI